MIFLPEKKKQTLKILVLFLVLILAIKGFAQNKIFKNYSLEEGLPQSVVLSMYQDQHGYLWAGTQAGVARFNGVDFKIYNSRDSIFDNHITAIEQDGHFNYWFGHRYNGISILQGGSFFHVSTIQSRVNDIEVDTYGNVYIATESEGLYITHQDDYKDFVKYQNLTYEKELVSQDLRDVEYIPDRNEVWVAGTSGINIIKLDTLGQIRAIENLNEWIDWGIYSLAAKPGNDTVWALSYRGLTTIISHQGKVDNYQYFQIDKSLIINQINNIVFDSLGEVWGATMSGIFRFDGKRFHHIDIPAEEETHEILIDFEGSIWISTFGAGLYRYSGDRFTYFDETNGLQDNTVYYVLEDSQNHIWIVTSQGLSKFDGKNIMTFSEKQGFTFNAPDVVFEDSKGFIWVGSYSANYILRYNPHSQRFDSFNQDLNTPQYILTINEDKNGDIWFATLGRPPRKFVYHANGYSGKFEVITKEQGIGSNLIWTIHRDLTGNLWFGTDDNGMTMFDGESFHLINRSTGLKNNCVGSICNDSKNNIWFVNIGAGIAKYNNEEFFYIDIEDGLSVNNPFSIIADHDDNIWVGTNSGIDCYNPGNGTFTHYTKNDGFIGIENNQNAICVDHSGSIWFGTVNGVFKLNPNSLEWKKVAPKIHIESLQLFYTDFNYLDYADSLGIYSKLPFNLELPSSKNHLTFNAAAVSFRSPKKIKYRYFLEGFDEDWTPFTSSNQITYSNLSPGKYTFNVMASADADFSNPAMDSFSFIIKTPYWQKMWFRMLAIVFFISLAWLIVKIRLRNIENKNKRLSELVEQQTREIKNEIRKKEIARKKAEQADRLKTTFLANMSHEIRSPLNSIIGFSDLLKEGDIAENERDKYIEYISRSGKNLLVLINDIIDVAKIEAGQIKIARKETNINAILSELFVIFHENINQVDKKIELELKRPLKDDLVYINTDPLRLKQIITNLLGNAIKFTAKGTIEFGYSIELINRKNFIQFYVKDTGIGIPDHKRAEIFERFGQVEEAFDKNQGGTGLGLSISKKLTEMLGGKMWVESIYKLGSTFYFTLPYLSILPDEVSSIKKKTTQDDTEWEGKTILVVEDDPMSFYFLEAILKPTGINVIWAKNGQEAFDKFINIKDKLDLVVTDINLPYVTGNELLVKIKEIKPNMPVVVQTAYAMVGEREKNLKLGFDDYISKPVNRTVFLQILRSFLSH